MSDSPSKMWRTPHAVAAHADYGQGGACGTDWGGPMKTRILLLEDDEAISELIMMVLGDEGYSVDWAPTTEDGIRQVQLTPPDLVLLDFTMLGSRGLEFFQRCRQDPSLSDLAIVVMSGASVATMTWSD